tara:strand:- start:320 stop:601 length:282 start_codon:yes stop_codon:yes gene_type:complete
VGKKRRMLKSPKFAKLRTHPKYVKLVAANKQENEEPNEVVIEVVEQKPEIVEEPKVVKLEKPKPAPKKKAAPKTKAKSKTKKTTAKKTTRKKK